MTDAAQVAKGATSEPGKPVSGKFHQPSSNVNCIDYPRRDGVQDDPEEPLFENMQILYKNDHYVIISKPFDVRLDGDFDRSVEKLVKKRFPEVDVLKMVHRLDYATSGVLCMARNRKACGRASQLFEKRKVSKMYSAVLDGHVDKSKLVAPTETEVLLKDVPESFLEPARNVLAKIPDSARVLMISAPIATALNDETHFRMEIGTDAHRDSREAVTIVQVDEHGSNQLDSSRDTPVTLVKLYLVTGRRHQLRVHTKLLGHPIVGDYTYGQGSDWRMMLHAQRLVLPLPTGTIECDTGDPFASVVGNGKRARIEDKTD